MLALMAALPGEGSIILSQLRNLRSHSCGHLTVFSGEVSGRRVVVTFSGIGKSNAAAATATLLANFSPHCLWMWGSGGAYPGANAELTTLALASEENYGEEGVATLKGWKSLDAIGISLAETEQGPLFNRIPVDDEELAWARQCLHHPQVPVHSGPFVTVSAASGSAARARLLQKRFAALCENMEGAAAAQVCLSCGIPFLEIRGLSNWAGDRNKKRWRLLPALENCQEAVLYLLRNRNPF